MGRQAWWTAGGYVAVVVTYALLSSVWTDTSSEWYATLEKPAFQPPDVVFGIIWPLNFLAILTVGLLLTRAHPERAQQSLALLTVSVVFALGWSNLFSQERLLWPAAVSLMVAAALTWALVASVSRAGWGYAAGLLVYAGWMTLAAALSLTIAAQN